THRVTEHQFDPFVWTDNKHRAYGRIVRRRAPLGRISGIGRQHVVELGDFQLRVADHRVFHLVALSLFNITCPFAVTTHRVHAQPDNLAVSLWRIRVRGSPYTPVQWCTLE